MKKWAIALCLLLCVQSWGREVELTCDNCDARIQKFQKMKTGGIILLVGGALAIVGGIAMVASAGGETQYQNINGEESGDIGGAFGAIFIAAGIPMTVAGGVFTGIASKKIRFYEDEKSGLNCSIFMNPAKRQIGLAYQF